MTDLKPAACPWCGSDEHLYVSKCGSLTGDMPDRPYRVVCDHIDHDQVQGPVAYGKQAAITAWNTRHQSGRTGAGEALREALSDSQSTLSAIKAECIARTEQEEDQMASHIAEICQNTMVTNAAALSQSTAGEDGDTPDE